MNSFVLIIVQEIENQLLFFFPFAPFIMSPSYIVHVNGPPELPTLLMHKEDCSMLNSFFYLPPVPLNLTYVRSKLGLSLKYCPAH
ncbi:MAG: hypothetical protein OEZ48_08455 [Candidatus Bathyarchaeota archaeon]|nr:hypothetical protein [Candidatus Bathyarchaeota archaeon]